MHRVFIDAWGFPIYSYGFMIMVGFLLAIWVASRRSHVVGIDPMVCIDLTVYLLVAGVVGARVMFVLHQWGQIWRPERGFFENLVQMGNIRDGGLEFYGGLLLAVPVGLWYLRRKRIPILTFMDIGLPAVLLGLAFGRVGCFLNGCCYGRIISAPAGLAKKIVMVYPQLLPTGEMSIPYGAHLEKGLIPIVAPGSGESCWKVTQLALEQVPGLSAMHYPIGSCLAVTTAPLLPSQLISSIVNIAAFLVLAWAWDRAYSQGRQLGSSGAGNAAPRRRPRYGEVAALFGIVYGIVRFSLEILRNDTEPFMLTAVRLVGKQGLTISQTISLLVLAVSVPAYIALRRGKVSRPIELLPGDGPI